MPAIWSALVVTAVWSIATGAYFAFRDDVTHPMTEMQTNYEKRIADLRAQFDRNRSQQFLDQERIQQQLAGLNSSQKMLTGTLVAIMLMTLLWWGHYAGTAEMEPVLGNQTFSEDF